MSDAEKIVIRGGRVYDHEGNVHKPNVADILIEGGKIVAVGQDLDRSGTATVLDARDKLVIPGLILMTRFAVAVPALVLEERSIRDAMRRSRELVQGHGGAIFWLFFCFGVLTGAVQLLLVFGAT